MKYTVTLLGFLCLTLTGCGDEKSDASDSSNPEVEAPSHQSHSAKPSQSILAVLNEAYFFTFRKTPQQTLHSSS